MSINESEAIKVYTNPKKGLWGKTKMMKKYREMLNKVYALQRHREINSKMKKKLYKREGAIRPFFSVQVDLADFPKLQNPLNGNVRYLLVCVDVFSRYLWVVPLKTKENLHIPMRQLFNSMKREFHTTPVNVTGDNEFDTRALKRLAEEFKFRWWFGDPNEKYRTGIVERVIRTIRNLMKRYLTQNDTTKYIDALPELVWNYNDTEHGHIRTKPRIALKSGQTFPKPMKHKVPVLRAGDMVRVLMPRKKTFDKGDKPYYSKEVYEVIKKDVNKYTVRNMETGEIPRKTYYIHQLLHIKGVIKDKSKPTNDRVGYDRGIEHKEIQKKNKRRLKGLDPKNIIDEKERKQSERDLHYNDEEFFHDEPLPSNISDKKLEKKQEQLEGKVEKEIDEIKELEQRISQLKHIKGKRVTVRRLKAKLEKLRELEKIKKKQQGLRRGRRQRKKPKRYGYD